MLLLCLWAWLLTGCSSLPPLEGRTVSWALSLDEARQTALGQAVASGIEAHPGLSGLYPLSDPHNAFAARMLLAQAAQRTLDVQYYIWRDDLTGTLMLRALLAAAERGVRVRLLLDDNGTTGLDERLAALDAHPNIEVRLFNPFVLRRAKALGYLTDFPRANRRMHNKSFTVDNQVAIIGGRNIGDEYFGASAGALFVDLDVLSVGPVVQAVSGDFDRYWGSASAYPVARLFAPAPVDGLARLRRAAMEAEGRPAGRHYLQALFATSFVSRLLQGRLELDWARTQMVSDDPDKGLGLAGGDGLLTRQLRRIVGSPERELELVSPYFVPTPAGMDYFLGLTREGVRMRVLTNSLAATDVVAVHAGYARQRKALLAAGVALYEMRPQRPKPERVRGSGFLGSSGSSLHAKTFAVDGTRIFIGSFNFDPRSARLNTELGFVIDSPILAERMAVSFEQSIPRQAYEVHLDANGELYWLERRGESLVRHEREPATGFWRRAAVGLLSILPIESLL